MLILITKIYPSDAAFRSGTLFQNAILIVEKSKGDFIQPFTTRKPCPIPVQGSCVQGTLIEVQDKKMLYQSITFFDVEYEIISYAALSQLQKSRYDKHTQFPGESNV